MATTKTELVNNINGDILVTKTSAPFDSFAWDSTGYSGDVDLVVKWYVDGGLVETSPIINLDEATAADTTAPTSVSASIEDANPDQLVWNLDENVNATGVTGLSITGDETPSITSIISGSGTSTLILQLSAAVSSGSALTLNVAATNDIADTAGNDLAATTQAITNNVAGAFSDPSSISPETMYHKFDVATTNAATVTSSTDSLTTTPYNLVNHIGSVVRATQNSKECIDLSGGVLKTAIVDLPFLDGSFSIHFEAKPKSLPGAIKYIFGLADTHDLQMDFRTDGACNVAYKSNGNVYALTANPLFTGSETDFVNIDIVFTKNDAIRIYKDNVEQALNASFNGDLSSNPMTFTSGNSPLHIGNGGGNSSDYPPMYIRNFIIQPVAWSSTDRANLATL